VHYTSLAPRTALATLLLAGSLFAASTGPQEAEMVVTPLGVEPSPNGGIVNMGAYGGTTEASKTAGN